MPFNAITIFIKNILMKVPIAYGTSTGTFLVHSKERDVQSVSPELRSEVGKGRNSVEC